MQFLRVFAQQGLVANWLEQKPPLAKVLKCFGVDRMAAKPKPVSVFAVKNEVEEAEAAAAVFQITPCSPEKRFGVVVHSGDCRAADIHIDTKEVGNTGIRRVDRRHANLVGTQDQFAVLVARIVKSMWEGARRTLHRWNCYKLCEPSPRLSV